MRYLETHPGVYAEVRRKKNVRGLRGALGVFLGLGLLGVLHFSNAWAAYGVDSANKQMDDAARTTGAPLLLPGSTLSKQAILKIQHFLRAQGLYLGPLDGRESPTLSRAVREFQKKTGLPIDGQITDTLARRIEQSEKIDTLLRRLEKNRRASTIKARDALRNHPETRYLIEDRDRISRETADPTRHPDACFAHPTPRCLLSEAFQSAKAIYKPEMRDWALGEILVSQAKAGIADDAMEAARRIHDPRLIMRALRDIAIGQAQAGQDAAAMNAARIIPDPQKKIEALIAIAEAQSRSRTQSRTQSQVQSQARTHAKSHAQAMGRTIARARTLIETFPNSRQRIEFYARLGAIALRANGSTARIAEDILRRAESLARGLPTPRERAHARDQLALAYARGGQPDIALRLMKIGGDAKPRAQQTPVLVASARQQVLAGDTAGALDTAKAIAGARYRAVIHASIAVSQAKAGAFAAAQDAIDTALKEAEGIKLPFAKSYALAHIALSLAEIADLASPRREASTLNTRALRTASSVGDVRLRAQTLWSIADIRAAGGDNDAYRRISSRAEAASASIKSALARSWMFADIATRRAQENDIPGARRAFARALDEAKRIEPSWGRARALAKSAAALSEIESIAMNAEP
ncbi:peptidoglycan-binding domain-containing protein [Varunaivibrio sulfuroxidans]|uniref:Putative peptidoglycan binding protein n=1 Tax=Varunaivibrio sulfuroxidans TaxID=1773489 RepID=A0A4V2UNN2_9PROT|nr:peptidoglycan-binding domain-containing protein [Varunaivibrio sulfuroxidans]TCS62661.1 putative peptidoglycan binding protein [Varunaivibrio sulfuroxidans]WES30674.1 peptidoglycan-binding domain-containing protein [Varunaivibrio sulfuroxidans]